jgi:GNAT superfamily N-acetyltransferase
VIAEISPVKPSEAHLVWPLLTEIATEELGFPEEALQHYRLTLTDEEIVRWAQSQKHVLIAARKDGKLVGILIGTPPEGGVGTILWLLVTPEYRGEGIGARIFEEACKRYKAIGCHKIKMTAPTKDAVMFYEKQGMQIEGFHIDHWWHLNFWSLGKRL